MSGEKRVCSAKIGQISGRPGSPRRTFCGSVMNERTFARIVSGSSASPIPLSSDFDILRPSEPGNEREIRQQRLGFDQHLTEEPIEPANDLPGDLEMGHLVLPHRHQLPADDRDVHGLQDRVAEQPEVRHVALGHVAQSLLVRRHALEPSERRDHPEEQRHLRDLGQVGLEVEDRSRGIDAAREEIQHDVFDQRRQLRGAVVVRREHVPVRDEVVALVSLVLEPDGVAHVAGPVPDVEVPGRPEAR